MKTTLQQWCLLASLFSANFQLFAQPANIQAVSPTHLAVKESVLWQNEPFGSFGAQKELKENRDQFSKHFRNDDGTITAHIAAGPIHYLANGQWQTIYHSIVPNSNGFENVWNSHKTYYPKQANGAIQTVLPSGQTLTDMMDMRMYFEQNGQAVGVKLIQPKNGQAQFNELTYAGVYGNGIDLRLTHNTLNRKMDYIIHSKTALGSIPSGATHLIFEEKAQLPTGWTAILVDNEILLKDAAGIIRAKYEKPVFHDTPTHQHDEHDNHIHEGHDHQIIGNYVIQQTGNTLTIKTKVPLNWLLDEHRAFPVVVDPTINCYPDNANNWTGGIETRSSGTSSHDASSTTYQTSNITNSYNGDFYLGRSSGEYVYRGWAKFNISSVPDDACISTASFHYNVFSDATNDYNCVVNNHIRHMANDPVPATNASRLTDIRDGDIYQTTNFANQGSGGGWKSRSLANNLHHLVNQLPVDWFSVGFHTFEGISGHTTCYVGIRGHAHSNRPYLAVTYADFTVSAGADVTTCGSGQVLNGSVIAANSPITLQFTPSGFADEARWIIESAIDGSTLASGGPYGIASMQTYSNSFAVPVRLRIRTDGPWGDNTCSWNVICNGSSIGSGNVSGGQNLIVLNNISCSPTISYSWSPATGLSATNIPNPTANPASTTTYTLTTTVDGCSKQDDVTVTVLPGSTSPTSVTGGGTFCHGNRIDLQTAGGTTAPDAQTVWYRGGCNNAFTEPWMNTSSWDWSGATTLNSVNGILNLTSTSNDPMISMPGLGSFDPAIYRYINVRYRVTAGTAGGMEIFFYNTASPVAIGAHYTGTTLISDNQWHIATLDLYQNPLYTTGGNITGWRYDWATATGVTMELDFIQLSQFPMIDDNTTDNQLTLLAGDPHYPLGGTTTYAAARIDNCGSTSCASTNVTLPTAGSTLGLNGESATCTVNQNGWVHFYHSSGRLIGSINSNGNNLGSVTMTVFVDPTNQQVPACDDPTNPNFFTAVMQRHWVVDDNPVGAITPNIQVGLPFYNSELGNLTTASTSNVNPVDDVAAIGDLLMSRYHGPLNVDHNALNNCPANGGNGGTVIHSQVMNGSTLAYSAVTNASFSVHTVPEFSELWLHGQIDLSPLPVELTAFNAVCEDNHVRVEWLTASEQNSSHFVIEKSRDGLTWESLGSVQAAGNSNTSNHYARNDYYASGITYYRMLQFDLDGQQKTYGPILANCASTSDELTVFPNPTAQEFTIQLFTETYSDNSKIAVYDLTGKVVHEIETKLEPGTNVHYVPQHQLARGTYTIRVENSNGNFQPVKLVIQ